MVISVCNCCSRVCCTCSHGAQNIHWQSCQINIVDNEQLTQVEHTLWCDAIRWWLPIPSSPYCLSCLQWLLLCHVHASGSTSFEIVFLIFILINNVFRLFLLPSFSYHAVFMSRQLLHCSLMYIYGLTLIWWPENRSNKRNRRDIREIESVLLGNRLYSFLRLG